MGSKDGYQFCHDGLVTESQSLIYLCCLLASYIYRVMYFVYDVSQRGLYGDATLLKWYNNILTLSLTLIKWCICFTAS